MRQYLGAGALALALVAGCKSDNGPAANTAGTLRLSFSSPNENDGALVMVITGPSITKIAAVGALKISTAAVGSNGQRVLVLGDLPGSGDILTFEVPDTSKTASYVTTLEQVADRTTFSLLSPGGYSLGVHK